MKHLLISAILASSLTTLAQSPADEVLRVLPPPPANGPVISNYLRYQTELAWTQDDQRRRKWEAIRSEAELLNVQKEIQQKLLSMIGGLPAEKTPLRPRVTGRVQMNGFHIEKLVYESLPGIYVPGLVYVPDDGAKKHPAILVPSGHAAQGKFYYQALCQRLVQRGYVVIAWDPVGQGERSQFWDPKSGKSRYNLICAEHAVMGNLAYLAGTNLARWEIWDGIRAVDYLLTRADVDPERINITGSSGGGTQTAYIAAIDKRIKVAAPSCYITALPMRVYNRIFKDPDSDPEQDLFGMISNGIDHPGLLLMMYPRPVFVAAAVLDFFPIEGTRKSFREVRSLYEKFGHASRIVMHESYNEHQYSEENQEAAMEFLDRFNGLPARHALATTKDLDEATLQCTKTGQVMLEFSDARSIMDDIRNYYEQHKSGTHPGLRELYYSQNQPKIDQWRISGYSGDPAEFGAVNFQPLGTTPIRDFIVERYLLRHSRYMELPVLWIHRTSSQRRPVLLLVSTRGKAEAPGWPEFTKQIEAGYDVLAFSPRGLGETRMPYKVESPDDPALAKMSSDESYFSPISGVLADYSYNAILTGRPYFLQMIEDVEIVSRFARVRLNAGNELSIMGLDGASTLASAAVEALPNTRLVKTPDDPPIKWSELVDQKRETWPIEVLLPGGAYIH
jgi:pimeloyl-ACP methyl ester carboxylesterase